MEQKWIRYSKKELADRIKVSFANGTFTPQDVNVIAPFYQFAMLKSLINAGIIRRIEHGVYQVVGAYGAVF